VNQFDAIKLGIFCNFDMNDFLQMGVKSGVKKIINETQKFLLM